MGRLDLDSLDDHCVRKKFGGVWMEQRKRTT
jgi:hypothetical protein